jgi:hypothetical protein
MDPQHGPITREPFVQIFSICEPKAGLRLSKHEHVAVVLVNINKAQPIQHLEGLLSCESLTSDVFAATSWQG